MYPQKQLFEVKLPKYSDDHVGWGRALRIWDTVGIEVTAAVLDGRRPLLAGRDAVRGPFLLATKRQIARLFGILVLGTVDKPTVLVNGERGGMPTHRFDNPNGWTPEGGNLALKLGDVDNPADQWIVDSVDTFAAEWVPVRVVHGEIHYSKSGRPFPTLALPAGVVVRTLEGTNPVSNDGQLLTYTAAAKRDYYLLPTDVVERTVEPYTG